MKNIVITGSTRGVGLCMAKEFLKAGCHVTISGRSEKSFELSKKELAEYTDSVFYAPCNVQVRADIQALWDQSTKKWGHVDCWINNAGLNCSYDFAYNTEHDDVDAVLDDNQKFQKIFNILADRPETVAAFFIPRILQNTKNNAHITWLTTQKSMLRFMTAPFIERKLI